MKWEFWTFPILALGSACLATAAGIQAAGSAPPPTAVIYQKHQTGALGPTYFRIDTLQVDPAGTWLAERSFPYAHPPAQVVLATGSLSAAQVAALQAVSQESFAASQAFTTLPPVVGKQIPGSGTRELAIRLADGTRHVVTAYGVAPASFERLDSAIASATVDLDRTGPFEAP
ncbi:MAG: hypothetical protein KGR26_02695 [Cyanobacteria bacterium REEB65]|nr:hypothetical protein [Cyanobacteria bacterium REEB65]